MGVWEDHQLVGSGSPALLGLEVLTDGLVQHCMPQVFLPVQDVAHSGGRPTVWVCHFAVSAILREVYFCSEFVSEVLVRSHALAMPKVPSLMRPNDYTHLSELRCRFEGKLNELLACKTLQLAA